ncbi:class I SAM-dependent methyltransferase [Candidatus Micrarchaeota archaeon]|nr:class I SAM-dependent methyltransferase [Candidatus Micrarchaeota archaeon]
MTEKLGFSFEPQLDGEPINGRGDIGAGQRVSEQLLLTGIADNGPESDELDSTAAALTRLFTQYAADIEKHEKEIGMELDKMGRNSPLEYANNLIKLLFSRKIWAGDYDRHMKVTGHDTAINKLFEQVFALDKLRALESRKLFIGKAILEMSCGTGTAIQLLCGNASAEVKSELKVFGNDISDAMKDIAREKLAGTCNVEYTSHDLRKLEFPNGTFDTAILSQTLHLITDPEKLKEEIDESSVRGISDHRNAKVEVIAGAFETLRPGGHFLLIDEWPAVLSETVANPVQRLVARLFSKTFRPIQERADIRTDIMTKIPDANFVAELKVPIDKWHSMYMFIYEKKEDSGPKKQLPAVGSAKKAQHDSDVLCYGVDPKEVLEMVVTDTSIAKARKDAEMRLDAAFSEVDEKFRNAYSHMNGGHRWKKFRRLLRPRTTLRIEKPSDIGRLGKKKWDTVVISRQMHQLTWEQKGKTIEKAIDALEECGALMIVDEWDPPYGSPYPIERKRQLWDEVMREFQKTDRIMFEASLKEPIMAGYEASNMYGYVYRKLK